MTDPTVLNVKTISKELRLLLAIMSIDHLPELPRQIISRHKNIDWDRFIELTRHHRVSPLVHVNAKQSLSRILPEKVSNILQNDYTHNTFQMLHLSAEIQRVYTAFEENGIRALVAKGPLLAEQLYGDTSLRTCKDLDILIPNEELERAGEILRKYGYVEKETINSDSMSEVRAHEVVYFHYEKKIQIELHWRLNWSAWEEPTFNEMWNRKKVITFKGMLINSFSDEDLFLSLVTHGARHGWFRLRWLADIDKLMKQDLDWSCIVKTLKAYNLLHIGAQALILCSSLFGAVFYEKLMQLKPKRRAYRLANLAIKRIQGRGTYQYVLSLVPGAVKRKYMMHLLKPSPSDVETLRLPYGLRFLYYPLRPMLYFWRRLTKRQGITKEL